MIGSAGPSFSLEIQIFESPTSHRPIFAAHVFTRRGSEPRRGTHPSPPANCGGCQSHPYRGGRIPNETARTKQLGVRGRPCHKGATVQNYNTAAVWHAPAPQTSLSECSRTPDILVGVLPHPRHLCRFDPRDSTRGFRPGRFRSEPTPLAIRSGRFDPRDSTRGFRSGRFDQRDSTRGLRRGRRKHRDKNTDSQNGVGRIGKPAGNPRESTANCGGCQSHPYPGGRTKQLGVRGRPCHKGASVVQSR